MKQLTEHPLNSLDENLDVGSVVKGKIVNVADYGAFLELTPGVEGLIHVSGNVMVTTPEKPIRFHEKMVMIWKLLFFP